MKNHLKVKQNYKKYLNGNQFKKNKYTQRKKCATFIHTNMK